MQITKLDQMFEILKPRPNKRLVAAWAVDAHTICAVHQAVEMDLVEGILVGDEKLIIRVCEAEKIDPSSFRIVHSASDTAAAAKAVAMINAGEGDFLMKGLLSTDRYMKAILNKERGLMENGAILSHVTVAEIPTYHKLLVFGDVAIIPLPDLAQKVAITNYLIRTAHFLGIEKPKVGIQAASEQTLPKIPSCADGALIAKMAQRGQIKNCVVDGPLDVFLACDPAAGGIKGVSTPIAGEADILIFPSLEAANAFYKGLMLFAGGELAGLIQGTLKPVVVMSRSESAA